jgi:predicted Zn-dependent protease
MRSFLMSRQGKLGLAFAAIIALSGCADMTDKQRSTAIGTGVGALGGAAIGSFSGNAGWGALIGAGAGALGGYAVGQSRENERRAYQRGVETGRSQR